VPLHHPTKTKGDLAVAHAYTDMTEQGYLVLWPTTEHAPFDLVAYRDKRFVRVQVKYRVATSTGVIHVKLSSIWTDKAQLHRVPMDKDEVDVVCVYCPTTGHCYYFCPGDYGGGVSLRLTRPGNNQAKKVTYAEGLRSMPDLDARSDRPPTTPPLALG
jgi:PD-(D/E)XK endonuclease